MTVDIAKGSGAAGHDIDAAVVDHASELGMVETDPGVDDADQDAVPGGSGSICGRRLNPFKSLVREVFSGLEETGRVSAHRFRTAAATAAAAGHDQQAK
jgi:hypothetical protein